jgi:hypothetical protein
MFDGKFGVPGGAPVITIPSGRCFGAGHGLSVFGSRHVWSARYLQSHLQHPVTPARAHGDSFEDGF